jgi:hypothetical protein
MKAFEILIVMARLNRAMTMEERELLKQSLKV